ncbi:MAG: preprotein translocase subunit SecY [Corallococcus sp.]|nr:preprotein translocase subunit SecY [Corallococcus sp.]
MIETFRNAWKIKEVRKKILFTLLFVVLFRLGCFIPVPGFNGIQASSGNDLTSLLNAITGNSLSQGTLFAIGISPYINASIIIQLLTVAIPPLERMSKQGEEGKKKINKITRWVTLGLAIVSALGVVLGLGGNGALNTNVLGGLGKDFLDSNIWILYIYVIAMLVAGSMLCMWIGERITEFGVSNGISILIFVGIISTAGTALVKSISGGNWLEVGLFLVGLVLIFAFIVWVDGAERKITVQYAKQVKGNKMYGGQSSSIPIKVNASGVMPLIFAFALLSFPSMIIQTFWGNKTDGFVQFWKDYMGTGTVVYTIVLAILIFVFAYFYSQIQFNPIEISKNIQQNGGFIPGIRPGRETSTYLAKVVSRITLWGAVFLAIIALVPSILFQIPVWTGAAAQDSMLLGSFSATGMLITVSVALEFHKALENQIMMRHYKGFLK